MANGKLNGISDMVGKALPVQSCEEGSALPLPSQSCKLCGASFPSEFGLILHFNEVHIIPHERKLGQAEAVLDLSDSEESENELYSNSDEETDSEDEKPEAQMLNFLSDCEIRLLQEHVIHFRDAEVPKDEGTLTSGNFVKLEADEDDGDISGDVEDANVTPWSTSHANLNEDPGSSKNKMDAFEPRALNGRTPMKKRSVTKPGAGMVSSKGKRSQKPKDCTERLECIFCEKSFPGHYLYLFNAHIRSHTLEKPYFCKFCDECFAAKQYRIRHFQRHHNPEKSPFVCKICEVGFKYEEDLANHLDQLHKKVYECSVCGNVFIRKTHLEEHMTVHTKEKPFECPRCGVGFSRKRDMTRHMAVHGVKPYECVICKTRFAQLNYLRNHMKIIHSKEKRFKCDHCSMWFSENSVKNMHMKSHTKPYECKQCKQRFTRNYHLQRHMTSVHDSANPFNCKMCGKKFRTTKGLRLHITSHSKA